ncbi:hypothetical protein FISHEDRAFT_32777 [Fistulina hepatica ATCC 64428]|uniref:CASTOR ACT domain-containing protein n=1 Tax=Fistulina hepatica ATCC 64428 TaxID=1128425 RepID=A0A0D7AQC3_9AGAR|nr:hypothetical protein FISHEDRAFT_32777 [Fistulina hepatica ATCC 64428]
MPPPAEHPAFQLSTSADSFFVLNYAPDSSSPFWVIDSILRPTNSLWHVTRTGEEISVICEVTPTKISFEEKQTYTESHTRWRCTKFAGLMEFDMTGIMTSFTAPLKEAQIPDSNTDYILVPEAKITAVENTLKKYGWFFGMPPTFKVVNKLLTS